MPVLSLTEKLDQLDARYEEMTQQLSSAEVVNDSARLQKMAKQHSELEQIVAKHREYKQIEKEPAGAQGNCRTRIETAAAAEGPERRQERDRGDSRWDGWR